MPGAAGLRQPCPKGIPCTGWPGCISADSARAPVAVSSPQGRFADAAAAVDGRVLRRASAWGKHLFHHYAGGADRARAPRSVRQVHRMAATCRWRCPTRSGRCGCGWSAPSTAPTCAGPTVCEVIDEAQVADVVARLGPDPLRRDADPAWAWARISKSRRPIGALLMDQTVIAGVGNVYRNELLFRHRIDPYRPGRAIGDAEFDAAWTDLVALMKVGLRRGKIITVRPEHDHGAPSYRPGSAADLRLSARRRAVPGVRNTDPHSRIWRAATCSGARPARRDRRAVAGFSSGTTGSAGRSA